MSLERSQPYRASAEPAELFMSTPIIQPGGELKVGAESEILYKGPNLMQGYWNQPEATADAFTEDGWLRTGDGGYVDNEGYLVATSDFKEPVGPSYWERDMHERSINS